MKGRTRKRRTKRPTKRRTKRPTKRLKRSRSRGGMFTSWPRWGRIVSSPQPAKRAPEWTAKDNANLGSLLQDEKNAAAAAEHDIMTESMEMAVMKAVENLDREEELERFIRDKIAHHQQLQLTNGLENNTPESQKTRKLMRQLAKQIKEGPERLELNRINASLRSIKGDPGEQPTTIWKMALNHIAARDGHPLPYIPPPSLDGARGMYSPSTSGTQSPTPPS